MDTLIFFHKNIDPSFVANFVSEQLFCLKLVWLDKIATVGSTIVYQIFAHFCCRKNYLCLVNFHTF